MHLHPEFTMCSYTTKWTREVALKVRDSFVFFVVVLITLFFSCCEWSHCCSLKAADFQYLSSCTHFFSFRSTFFLVGPINQGKKLIDFHNCGEAAMRIGTLVVLFIAIALAIVCGAYVSHAFKYHSLVLTYGLLCWKKHKDINNSALVHVQKTLVRFLF